MPPASGLEHGKAAGASNVQNLCRSCGPQSRHPPPAAAMQLPAAAPLPQDRAAGLFQTPASPLLPADDSLLAGAAV